MLIIRSFIVLCFFIISMTIVHATNQGCVLPRCNKCSSRQVTMVRKYAMPERNLQNDIRTCLPIKGVRDFNKCVKGGNPPARCDCSITEWCVSQLAEVPGTLEVIFDYPKNCGYKWRGFSMSRYREDVRHFIANGDVNCNHSMCTSAVFMALIAHAKKSKKSRSITNDELGELTTPGGKAYRIINENTEPNVLVEVYGLGKGYTFDGAREIARTGKNIPKKGDLIQIWRRNGSGHSAIFKGFIDKNKDGVNDFLCYWSSQKKTNGYGDRCETIHDMETLRVGSFN